MKPVALKLEDHTQALVAKTNFIDCVAQKDKGAKGYLVQHASSVILATSNATTHEQTSWAFDEVYAPLATEVLLSSLQLTIMVFRCKSHTPCSFGFWRFPPEGATHTCTQHSGL